MLTYNPLPQEKDKAILMAEQATNLGDALGSIKPKVMSKTRLRNALNLQVWEIIRALMIEQGASRRSKDIPD